MRARERGISPFVIAPQSDLLYKRQVAKRVEYSRHALRTLHRIDRTTSKRIVLKVEQLAERPESLANNVRALKGPGGFWRLRVGGWRVIYTATLVVIAVERIAPRGSAYD